MWRTSLRRVAKPVDAFEPSSLLGGGNTMHANDDDANDTDSLTDVLAAKGVAGLKVASIG